MTDPSGQIVAFTPTHSDSAKLTRGTAVVFHGKGGHASQRVFYIAALENRGFQVVLVEYPGFDGRTGHPSEKRIVEEDRALIRRLAAAGRGPITLWGESLGTGIARSVAADPTLPIQGIVLITPFDSVEHIAAHRYPYVPVSLLLRDKYDSATNLANFKHPVVLVEAGHDTSIPAWSTDNLYNALPNPALKKRILLPDCNHNNWPHTPEQTWWTDAADFVSPHE
jgi:alpha-beta hydrolase superfamily lysophospholipase